MGSCYVSKSITDNVAEAESTEGVPKEFFKTFQMPQKVKKGDLDPKFVKTDKTFVKSNQGVKRLKQVYDIEMKVLGAGAFGKIFFATNKDDSSIRVAIKVIDKKKLDEVELEILNNEVRMMQSIDHPNIVKYHETYDDKEYIYIVMEMCDGGEFVDSVVKNAHK